jgi:hypothetical protein
MDIKQMLAGLKNERQRVEQAIAALEALDGSGTRLGFPGKHTVTSVATAPKRRGRMSAAGRKRISEMMKARWAARRKAAKKA